MKIQFFISYSGADGISHAKKIHETISSATPNVKLWMDKFENRLQHEK